MSQVWKTCGDPLSRRACPFVCPARRRTDRVNRRHIAPEPVGGLVRSDNHRTEAATVKRRHATARMETLDDIREVRVVGKVGQRLKHEKRRCHCDSTAVRTRCARCRRSTLPPARW